MSDFKEGATVYLPTGQKAEYVAKYPGGHVVRVANEAWVDDDCGPWAEPIEICVGMVFAEFPAAKKHEDIAALEAKITEKRAQLDATRHEVSEADKERQRLLEKAKQISVLRRIENIMDGNFTHVVSKDEYRHNVKVEPIDALESKDRHDRPEPGEHKWRMLALFGSAKGDLEWKVNQYRDGSGSWSLCAPACSEEEARELGREFIAEALQHVNSGYLWVPAAREWGVPVPTELAEKYDRVREKQRQSSIEQAEKAFHEAKQRLAKVRAEDGGN